VAAVYTFFEADTHPDVLHPRHDGGAARKRRYAGGKISSVSRSAGLGIQRWRVGATSDPKPVR